MKTYIALILGAGLLACSDAYEITVSANQIEVNNTIDSDLGLDSMIAPYRAEMTAKMSDVISKAENDFVKGRPHGALNNWSADAIYQHEVYNEKGVKFDQPVFCLLNVGGLRNPLSSGDITLGDMYKLMPFDNEIVWVEMPWTSISDISSYLIEKGGEPISGAHLKEDSLYIDGVSEESETFWVITSDYLMNGGDKMTFFENKTSFKYSGTLMRDAMIQQAKVQSTLIFDDNPRIEL